MSRLPILWLADGVGCSVLRFLPLGGHLHQTRIEPAERLHQIGLRGHHGIDVFVGQRHFINAGAEQVDSLL